ncbi:MAG: TonB-dependent receptor plug domain-containing protein [Paludibacter sp.]|nr:TonB-dependent receptor plug domain-containing protein [Paludibacter sp.]
MFKKVIPCLHVLRAVVLLSVLFCSSFARAEELKTDSLYRKNLNEVVVNGYHLQVLKASLPVQISSGKELTMLNAASVSDIARYFSGVTIKDYGGIGGMKTVSLRGMDAPYTGVSYDGVIMSDIQSGQIDLGRFPLDNISEVSLTNGQPNDIFQSARLFSSGGVLCLKTKFLNYNKNQSFDGKVTFKTGSFGLLNPGLFLTKNIGEKWTFNLSADALTANGEYTFRQYYGSTDNLSEELTRTNCDIKSLRTEVNGMFRIRDNETISLKANFFDSERGLPGNITFYNTDDSQQRLKDRTFFSQIHYENRTSDKFQHQYFARINISDNHFQDADSKYAETGGILNDNYLQKEYYLSSSFQYKLLNSLFISASTDWWYNNLNINSNVDFKDFQFPTRHTGLANIAAKYFNEKLTLGANLLYTLTRENVHTGVPAPDRDKLSPTINLSYKLLGDKELRIRAFYKNIYRLPTFNDLYYQDMGNHNLRPEDASQYNLGFTYQDAEIPFISDFTVMADGYYNRVADKIIAVPRDMFHWSMINKSKVNILGLDISVKASTSVGKSDMVKLKGNYSFQSAKDATVGSDNYGEQIPYTPVHSGSGSLSYQHGKWEAGYNMIFSGIRWIGQMTDQRNKMDGYMIHSVFVSTTYKKWNVNAEIIDLFNTQYEVVKFYPMPRRNFRITLVMNFKK